MATKLKNVGVTSLTWAYLEKTLEIFMYREIGPRAAKFYMWLCIVGL